MLYSRCLLVLWALAAISGLAHATVRGTAPPAATRRAARATQQGAGAAGATNPTMQHHHHRGRRLPVGRPTPSALEIQAVLRLSSNTTVAAARGSLLSIVNVLDFGAVADGVSDNTKAFQTALDSVAEAGGICYVPAGNYSFDYSVTRPVGVALVGTSQAVADAPGCPGGSKHCDAGGGGHPSTGSILLTRGGRGNETATPFLTVNENAAVRGLTLFYPGNVFNATPAPYPWAVDMVGDNAAIVDCLLLNPWLGIRAVNANRHYIARVQGQPVKIGVSVDATFDIGRIEDVHFMHLYSVDDAYLTTLGTIGTGFVIARSDWEYVFNTFVFEMAIGYHFVESEFGSCNGNFVGIGADATQNASVLIDSADASGILIVNGEFTSFTHPGIDNIGANTQVVVSGGNKGAVRFTSCAFWGPGAAIAVINGTSTSSVGFDDCIFSTFDAQPNATRFPAAITLQGPGALLVRGCEFQSTHPGGQVLLADGSGKAIVKDNLITGPLNVTDLGARISIVKDNAADE
jgi:hypothetical protein